MERALNIAEYRQMIGLGEGSSVRPWRLADTLVTVGDVTPLGVRRPALRDFGLNEPLGRMI